MPARNRRNRTDAPANGQDAAPDAMVQDAPAPDTERGDQVQDAPAPEAQPEPAPQGTAPADAPEVQDAPAPDAPAEPEHDAPAPDAPEGDAPAPDTEPEQDGDTDNVPTVQDFLAMATDAEAAQDNREVWFTRAAVMALNSAVDATAALPDDMPVLADTLHFRVSGASGRGVAVARGILHIAQAMLGAGYYDGSTHGSIKGSDADSVRRMKVYVVVPRALAPVFPEFVAALEHSAGPFVRPEQAAYAGGREKFKSGRGQGRTEYQLVNKAGRAAIGAVAGRLAAAVQAAFPADDPRAEVIRRMVAASASEHTRLAGSGLLPLNVVMRNATPVTDAYAPAPAGEAVSA